MPFDVLCYSRSYLSHFLPKLGNADNRLRFWHIVQSDSERTTVEKAGGTVVLVLDEVIKTALLAKEKLPWVEPEDFRDTTDFPWSPIHCDRYLPTFSLEVRQAIAGAIFAALERVSAERQYAGFLSEPVAIFPTHVMLYLCKRSGMVPLLWAGTFFPGYVNFSASTSIAHPKRTSLISEEEEAELRRIVSAYVDGIRADKAGPAYHPKFSGKKNKPLDYFTQRRGGLARVVEGGVVGIGIQFLRLMRAVVSRITFPHFTSYMVAGAVSEHWLYLKCLLAWRNGYDEIPESYGAKDIFFPVQFEPEASLLYLAPDFRDQAALVETMLQAIGSGQTLWVKEHPNQYGFLKQRRWQVLRRKYGNLKLVHGRDSGRELIKKCALGVAITSSAGMDALILNRHVLVVGQIYYRNYKGAIPVSGYQELARELNKPDNYLIHERRDETIECLVGLGKNSYPGFISPSRVLYDPENISKVVNAISEHLNENISVSCND